MDEEQLEELRRRLRFQRALSKTMVECSMDIHRYRSKPGYPERVVKDKNGILVWNWEDKIEGH